jgi:hypothetical protein
MGKFLVQQDFIDAAKKLNVEVAVIKAVSEVESAGSGFLEDNRFPKILFEPFVFGRRTKHKFNGATTTINGVVYPLSLQGKWSAKEAKYGKSNIQFQKLDAASKLNRQVALESCSWGKFQIMGYNYYLCGYKDLSSFVGEMYISEGKHLLAFVEFIKNQSLAGYLRNKQWAKFAKAYNGESYAQNQYDIKLEKAYQKHKKDETIVNIDIDPLPIEAMPPINIDTLMAQMNKAIKYLTK